MHMIHALHIEFQLNGQLQTITPVLLQDKDHTILVDCGYPNFIDHIREAAATWTLHSIQSHISS